MGLEYFGFSVLIKLSNSFIKLVIHFKPAVKWINFLQKKWRHSRRLTTEVFSILRKSRLTLFLFLKKFNVSVPLHVLTKSFSVSINIFLTLPIYFLELGSLLFNIIFITSSSKSTIAGIAQKNEVFQMWPNPQFPADLITFTGEILNGKLHFLFSEDYSDYQKSSFLNVINAMHQHTMAFAKLIVLFYRENMVLGLMRSANPQFFAPNLQILQSFVLKLYHNCVIIVLVIKKEKWITCHMYLTATQMNVDLLFLFTLFFDSISVVLFFSISKFLITFRISLF